MLLLNNDKIVYIDLFGVEYSKNVVIIYLTISWRKYCSSFLIPAAKLPLNNIPRRGDNGLFIALPSSCLLTIPSIWIEFCFIHKFVSDMYSLILSSVTEFPHIKSSRYSKGYGMGTLANRK